MRKEVLFEVLGEIDGAYVERAGCCGSAGAESEDRIAAGTGARRESRAGGDSGREICADGSRRALRWKPVWKRCAAVAVCIVLTAAGLHLWNAGHSWELSEASRGVSVRNVSRVPDVVSSACLVWLSEEELFSHFDTVVFSGTIMSIENIVIDFKGTREYRAIAEIAVEKVYRGGLEEGRSLAVLIPCGIGDGPYVTGMDTVAAMEPGMRGIFMPTVYDAADVWQENGAALALKDIADYGFADGCRYAFLDTGAGLVFDRAAYESIAEAESLEEIEAYVRRMLGSAVF